MILFKDWQIAVYEKLLAMQHDNLTRELQVVGEIPKDWNWEALVEVKEYFDIIPLPFQPDGSLKVTLTAEQVAINGYYTIQLRGTRKDEVKHTNTTWVYVGDSLSGDEHWPVIPSAFTEFEQKIMDAVERAEDAAERAESPEGGGGGSGLPYKIGLGLKVTEDQTLVVDSAENFDGDNDRPASAALVKTQLGNIEAFLATI